MLATLSVAAAAGLTVGGHFYAGLRSSHLFCGTSAHRIPYPPPSAHPLSAAERVSAMSTQTVQLNKQAISWWVAVVVLLGALLMGAGAVLAFVHPVMLVSPHDQINGAVRVYAGYLTARNGVLAIMLVALLVLRARRALGNLMVIVAFIQFLDASMDLLEGRWILVPGVLVFGLIYLIAATRLSGYAFWRSEAWNG